MKTIKVPVTVGKRERLIKAKDTEFIISDEVAIINRLYIKETPKDFDDDFSPVIENRMEFCCTLKRSAVTDISVVSQFEVYCVTISIGATDASQLFMENREAAISLYDQLVEWWLK